MTKTEPSENAGQPPTREEIEQTLRVCDAATPGPWKSMRDGNQYINTRYMPTAKCVASSKIEGIQRPWNPHSYVAFGFKPDEFETVRLIDSDADFIAAARTELPRLCRLALQQMDDDLEHDLEHAETVAANSRLVEKLDAAEADIERLNDNINSLLRKSSLQDNEIERQREMLKRWVPEPHELSGWDDDDATVDEQDAIREACEVHGVECPEHCREDAE